MLLVCYLITISVTIHCNVISITISFTAYCHIISITFYYIIMYFLLKFLLYHVIRLSSLCYVIMYLHWCFLLQFKLCAIYQHSVSNNHPKTNISLFKIIDQDSKEVAREAIHIRVNNPALDHNMGKMYISEIFKQPSWSVWILQWVQPYGRLWLPTKSHSPYHSK